MLLGQREGFDFGEDVSLRRQQQPHGSLAGFEIANIRSQNCIQVALRVGPEKEKNARKFVSTRATASRAAEYSAVKSPNREGKSVPKYSPISARADRCRSSNGVSSGMVVFAVSRTAISS